ncbi:ATP-dependent RNA helicase [Salmonella enterica subsp. enterica serovar Typhimurium]|nr:ATP-dependent RNA helicase [Salmonella enterica subsp. enterica serovar Typhimurium]
MRPPRQPLLPLAAEMATLCIDGGKKAKMRPGDILGALTGDIGLDGADIGKINVHPMHVYVAVRQAVAQKAWKQFAKREDQRQVMPGTAIKMIDSMASQRSAETPADYFTSITSSRNASKAVSSSSGCQPAGCKGISSRSNAKSPPSTTSEP